VTLKKKTHQLLILFVLIVFAGCAQTIPYKANLQLQPIPSEDKLNRNLTTLMSEKLKELVVTIKPIDIPGATAYRFQVGESMQTNFLNIFGQLFQDVKISTSSLIELSNTSYFLEVQLDNYDFHIAPSIFGTHTAKLQIRYSFYDTNKTLLFTITTETNGSSVSTQAEIWGRVYIPFEALVSSGYRNSIARAYDEALAKSIDELIKLIEKALKG
jgi:hypothetical protein